MVRKKVKRNRLCRCEHRIGSHNLVGYCSLCKCRKIKPTEKFQTWKDEFILLAVEALNSCGDNYGSEAADNGKYEKYYDSELIDNALQIYKNNKR